LISTFSSKSIWVHISGARHGAPEFVHKFEMLATRPIAESVVIP